MMTHREHELNHGADCWCEPRVEQVIADDGEVSRIYVHWCDDCERNPCICSVKRKHYHSKR